jgi:hypothetical protein
VKTASTGMSASFGAKRSANSGTNLGGKFAAAITPDLLFRFVLGAFAVVTISLAVLIPAWEANDEPDHVRNIETLVSGRWYRIEPDAGYQPHQAPLYYLAIAGWQKVVGIDPWVPTLNANPGAPAAGQFTHDDAPAQRRVSVLRLPSIVFGLITIFLTRKIGRVVGLGEWGSVAAAAILASIPRFVFLSSVVTNDTLAITLGTLSIWLAVRSWQSKRFSDLVFLGVSTGLLLSTKLTAVPFVAVLTGLPLLRAAVTRFRGSPNAPGSATTAQSRFGRSILPPLLPALVMLVVAAPILISNHIRYGDPLATQASMDYLRNVIPGLIVSNTAFSWLGISVTSGFLTSFWYTSGWNQFRWRAITYTPLWVLAGIGLLGLLRGFRSRHREPDDVSQSATPTALLSFGLVGATSSVWILAASTTQWQARISFPALSAFAVLVVLGYKRLRLPTIVWFVLPLISTLGTLYAIQSDVLGRYY